MITTIGLISNVDPTELKNTKEDKVILHYKKLKINSISNADIALIIASNSFPFFTKDGNYQLEDNPRYAIAVYFNEIYGKNTPWESIEFISPHLINLDEIESSDDDDEVEVVGEEYDEEEEKYEYNKKGQKIRKMLEIERATKRVNETRKKLKFFENKERVKLYYDETNANKLIRSDEYLGICDYVYNYPSIKDPNLINFESIMFEWKVDLIEKRKNNETSPTITIAIDNLFKKYPFVEKEMSEMDYDYLEKPFLIDDDDTTTTTNVDTTNINTNTDVKNITNKKMLVISSDSDE